MYDETSSWLWCYTELACVCKLRKIFVFKMVRKHINAAGIPDLLKEDVF
jgi:hypothetical protein